MTIFDIFLYLSMILGFFMAFNLGGNDVANSMASAVGARAITVKQAVYIAGSLSFVGAVFLGSHVTATISKGIINPEMIADPKIIMLGMFSSLLAAGLWVFIATLTALPISSTHSIVGSMLGFGLAAGGIGTVNWIILGGVVLSWIISPFFAATLSFLIFTHIKNTILNQKRFIHQTKKWAPIWVALTFSLVILSFLYKTPTGKELDLRWWVPLILTAAAFLGIYLGGRFIVHKILAGREKNVDSVENIFKRMQLLTSCYVALSHGANDVANAIGPVVAVYIIAKQHVFVPEAEIPLAILVLGGLGISMGITIFGSRVMATVGERITQLNNTRGFSVDFGAATTILLASKLGLPVSSTHAAVGGVAGVGLARGFKAVDFSVLGKIFMYWVLTVPIAAFTSLLIFNILKAIIL
ncbi:MAG: inorganic phosphate transporter [Desulfonatronovibrionaceae bacterium]